MATTPAKRACSVCGTLLADDSPYCPVCALQGAASPETESISAISSELRFEHYQVLRNQDGKPLELGHGGMGVTYKAIDTHLGCSVALKIIRAQFLGNESARSRFLREARAAASVRHVNVASVFHLGESGGNYFYAMEFVDGETLEALIRRRDRLEIELALEIVTQVAAGLTAIHKQHLVHRDIKPSNIMLGSEEGRLETVKIIDLGLAKGVAEDSLSVAGSFIGTPTYASPEQFAGLGTDIRSDLYSLGVTLWEMLSGKPPFRGSAAELMDQHQHAVPPFEKLQDIAGPIFALLQVLLDKDPNQRFSTPAQLQQALMKVRGAIGSELGLTPEELKSGSDQAKEKVAKSTSRRKTVRWLLSAGLCLVIILAAWFFLSGHAGFLFHQQVAETAPPEKSVAVLPFENISPNKDDAYFADGVQDEILSNVARISQLKVISRTSVMQYRAEAKRDLRQIANALGVANILEGTVRRAANRVRITIELVDARTDQTIWSESYDRDLTDIFAIQSEVAETIAHKLAATLSPEEKKSIDAKPTDNLEAYDLYLQAKKLIDYAAVNPFATGNYERPLLEAVSLLEQAVRFDSEFVRAYCASAYAHDELYNGYDMTPMRRALGDAAVANALRLQPDLPEVHLRYGYHLYRGYRDYEGARAQVAIARRGMPNSPEVLALEAFMDRRQGNFEKAVQELKEAITLDPRNPTIELANTLFMEREFSAAEQAYNRAIDLAPDHPILGVLKAFVSSQKIGDNTPLRSAIAALPSAMAEDADVLNWHLNCALNDRDWRQAIELIEKMKDGEDDGLFAYAGVPVPAGCYFMLIAGLQGEKLGGTSTFADVRERLTQKVQRSSGNPRLLSQLAVVDALLGKKQDAIAEAERAVEMLPISKDAVDGPLLSINLAVVYAWTDKPDLAFKTLGSLKKTPSGIYYGSLKFEPYWEPLRKDPRFDKLLAELAPRD